MRFHIRRVALSVGTALYVLLAFRVTILNRDWFSTDPEPVPKDTQKIRSQDRATVPFEADVAPVNYLLNPNFTANTVFYVWCNWSELQFKHYLSIRSVIKHIRPDNVIFYYMKEPTLDGNYYNIFYGELKSEFAFFRPVYGGDFNDPPMCDRFHANKEFVFKLLNEWGGWYMHETTMISNYTAGFRNVEFLDGISRATRRGFLLSQRGFPIANMDAADNKHITCAPNPDHYVLANNNSKPFCVDVHVSFWPKDIWARDDDFGRLCRHIFYGSPEIPVARQDYSVLAPNIGHMIWVDGGPMDFLFFLGVLSLLYVAEVEMLYIHGDGPPTGHYWSKIRSHPRLQYIFRKPPLEVYGQQVTDRPHLSDVWRVDIMTRYGGIYIDSDSLVVRKFDEHIRAFDAVVSYDWPQWNLPYPDTFNFGVTVGKRNAPFWRKFKSSFKWFIDADWTFNGLRQPYNIYERHPHLLHVEPHLQVICYQQACHPTWVERYHEKSWNHLTNNSITDWRNDAYAYHWTLPNPDEFVDEYMLFNSNHTIFGQIGNHVMEKAGMIGEKLVRKVGEAKPRMVKFLKHHFSFYK